MLSYCAADVDATVELFLKMRSRWGAELELRQALFRGYFVQMNDRIEQVGIPIDAATWATISARRLELRKWFIQDLGFADLFDGETFRRKKFENFVASFAGVLIILPLRQFHTTTVLSIPLVCCSSSLA
jgi:hypothetical protein